MKVLEEEGYEVASADVTKAPLAECAEKANEADVLLVGSPTINRAAPKAVWDVLTSIDPTNLKGKAAGAFGAYGWSGEAVPALCERLARLKANVFGEGLRVQFVPTEQELEAARAFGRAFGETL